jgi:AbrB family looped-hinge helix DNA binding protein
METTLDKFGRVVIPKEIRDNLGLKSGEVLEVEESENEIILRPLRKKVPLHIKDGVLIFSGTATGDIMEAIRIHREERLRKVSSYHKK